MLHNELLFLFPESVHRLGVGLVEESPLLRELFLSGAALVDGGRDLGQLCLEAVPLLLQCFDLLIQLTARLLEALPLSVLVLLHLLLPRLGVQHPVLNVVQEVAQGGGAVFQGAD